MPSGRSFCVSGQQHGRGVPRHENAGSAVPRYQVIRDALEASIRSGRVPQGLVIIEKPVADIFGTSRAPVRRALKELHDQGLLQRFEGRGYLAGTSASAEPIRQRLDARVLGLETDTRITVDSRALADRIQDDVQQVLATAMAFGQFRVQAIELATHYGVSRTVAREVLMRLRDRRIVGKDSSGHWVVGPLTARAMREDYEIRRVLEPVALRGSAPKLGDDELRAMQRRLDQAMNGSAEPSVSLLREIERDLHERCLRFHDNDRMRGIIRHSQLPLVVNNVFYMVVGRAKESPALAEHACVIAHLLRKDAGAAALSLESHLEAAAERTRQRLKALSVFPEPQLPDYLLRVT
ncbi:GntR family transcriptional regulator [Spiribacter halobius]|uniref:GntR family transcriptional regulator n=1 Tax=Sediminicurvatus halobius TaxID=2182432 RepID=A0A2U2MY71_9GAMM|nr:GntR family transcriptional regulator [Spiribacter halobius]PWG61820.1 GntR family transcriptional regulator [Spiribacter halobius]UEX77660.1 GntR family transcriptional regulator [Spiribacter halobius]